MGTEDQPQILVVSRLLRKADDFIIKLERIPTDLLDEDDQEQVVELKKYLAMTSVVLLNIEASLGVPNAIDAKEMEDAYKIFISQTDSQFTFIQNELLISYLSINKTRTH
jgi:hypothetical protein